MKTRPESEATPALVEDVLAGDPVAQRRLWELVLPCIHDAVMSELERCRYRTARRDVEDFVHDVAVKVFDGTVLRQWDRRRPLEPYLATTSKHLVASALRTKKKNPNTNEPLRDDWKETASERASPEAEVASNEIVEKAIPLVEGRLTKTGKTVLRSALDGQSTADLCRETRMSPGAVHTQRSRIFVAIRRVLGHLDGEPEED